MLVLFLTRLLTVLSLPSTTAGVVYYVKPTEPCAHNSCPSNDTCHTMDHYANNSSHYFSPDHINVTLYFMCGVHNCTQHVDISDLQTFAMIGTAGRQHVFINMPIPTEAVILAQDMGSQHFYTFTNISNVTITNISISYISVSFKGKDFYMTNANFYGYTNFTSLYVSAIIITGSSALFDNCTFQENSFLNYQSNAVIIVHDCTFNSYNHMLYPAIMGLNSTLNLSGSVRFLNNIVGSPSIKYVPCGAAIYLAYNVIQVLNHYYIPRSMLTINDDASVHFVNNSAVCGGAVYLSNTAVNIGNKVDMNFCENRAMRSFGGAILLDNSSISTAANVKLNFNSNFASMDGGAIAMQSQSKITLNSNAVVTFTSNRAVNSGGVIYITDHSNINITGDVVVHMFHNTVVNYGGGAIYLSYSHLFVHKSVLFIGNNSAPRYGGGGVFMYSGNLHVSEHSVVNFTDNIAYLQGGAIYMSLGGYISIDSHSLLTFSNNSASQGGAILLDNSSISIAANVKLNFNSNFASMEGGAIAMQSQSKITLNSNAVVTFTSNHAVNSGGVIYITDHSNINITGDVVVHMFHNTVVNYGGGAIYLSYSHLFVHKSVLFIGNNSAPSYGGGGVLMYSGNFNVSEHSVVNFTDNIAYLQGGAIYMSLGGYISIDSHSLLTFSNNSASQGGALYLPPSATVNVGKNSIVLFVNNSASDRGGAVYANAHFDLPCFLVFISYSGAVIFEGNVANSGIGMDVYGASIRSSTCATHSNQTKTLPYCGNKTNISFIPSDFNSSLSSVSSDPKRVCLCDSNGYPHCANLSKIFVNGLRVYSGEQLNFSLVVVGHDFGVTTGTITANFIHQNGHSESKLDRYNYWLRKTQCSNVTYTIFSTNEIENLYLKTTTNNSIVSTYGNKGSIINSIETYNSHGHHGCLDQYLLTTPVYVTVSILPGCPPGFRFDEDTGCSCFQIVSIKCYIKNNTGYFKWNSTMWINAKNDTIMISQHCPSDYCLSGEKIVDLASNPDTQCDFNHAGTLCGGCEKHYSLAIGSSRCIQCSSNSNLSLFLFFIVAGIVLVIIILVLNLTVTQGLINGLILYANLLWTYKDILFLSGQKPMPYLFQIFIAWLNLDFGIETCLIVGLTAFWKTWLQFLFPLYIWLIAGVIIIVCRYSSRLTNLIGDRAVPLLATLFLLSYTKLLRTVMTILEFGGLILYPDEINITVWYLDGNLSYCQHPHIYLFIAAMVTLFFCLSFTLFLLLIQCWRRISHLRLLRWINKFIPFYDAYFAPLKDKHHYWFGTLLLVRIALLISFTATSSTLPFISLFILQLTSVVLLFYTSIRHVYKSKLVRMLESTSLLNLIILIGFTLYTRGGQTTFLEVSIAFAFIQFTFIIIISLIKIFFNVRQKCMGRNGYHLLNQDVDSSDEMVHKRVEDPEIRDQLVCRRNLRNTVETY